jgi:hypothetical protein
MRSLQRYHHAPEVVAWVRQVAEALDEQVPTAVRDVVEDRVLAPAQASDLFELFVGFRIVDALLADGFREAQVRLIPSKTVPFAALSRGQENVRLFWQRSLWSATGTETSTSTFRAVLDGALMRQSQLRPDFVLKMTNPSRLLFVEVKLTEDGVKTRDRVGIRDALGYAYDAETLLARYPQPHGLVVAWNAEGVPSGLAEILVASQASISAAISEVLARWAQS